MDLKLSEYSELLDLSELSEYSKYSELFELSEYCENTTSCGRLIIENCIQVYKNTIGENLKIETLIKLPF